MLEAINIGGAIQGHEINPDTIASAKVPEITGRNRRLERKIEEERKAEEAQKREKQIQISQALLDDLEHDINIIHNVSLQFSVHDASGRNVIRVVEKDTGNLIRQIPPEGILNLVARMHEVLGILFDKKV